MVGQEWKLMDEASKQEWMEKARVLKETFENEVEQVVQTDKAPKKKKIIARVQFNKPIDESVSSFTSQVESSSAGKRNPINFKWVENIQALQIATERQQHSHEWQCN